MRFFETSFPAVVKHQHLRSPGIGFWVVMVFAGVIAQPHLSVAEESEAGPSPASKINFPIESEAPKQVAEISALPKFEFNTELRGSSALTPTESESFEITRRAERLSNLMDMNFFAGYYEFDEGPEDDYSAMKAGMDVAITNKIHFEASFFRDHDLDESNGFIGLWGAIPIGERKEEEHSELGAVRSLWSAVTPSTFSRMRTRKQHPGDEPKESGYEPIEIPNPESETGSETNESSEERKNVLSRVWKTVRQDRERDSQKVQAEPKREGRLGRLFGRNRD